MSTKKLPETTSEWSSFAKDMHEIQHDPHQTVRDTTSMIGKDYIRRLRAIVDNQRSYPDTYYIISYLRHDLPVHNTLHTTFVSRKTLPQPTFDTIAWEVDNRKSSVMLWWSLPNEAEAKQVVMRPEFFDEKLVMDCRAMFSEKKPIELMKRINVDV